MQAVTGVFVSQADAQRAVDALRSKGVPSDKITLLTAGSSDKQAESVPVDAAESPGMGKAIGAVVGGVGGFSGGPRLDGSGGGCHRSRLSRACLRHRSAFGCLTAKAARSPCLVENKTQILLCRRFSSSAGWMPDPGVISTTGRHLAWR